MYSEQTLEHFRHPSHVGEMAGKDVVSGNGESERCHDFVKVWLRLAGGRVSEARFKAFGCAAAIAAADAAMELCEGRRAEELEALDAGTLEAALGWLPQGKRECAATVLLALADARLAAP
jgi:NifU-like protein involved in Fe-S cluster formation